MKRILLIGPPGSHLKHVTDSLASSFNWNPICCGNVIQKHVRNDESEKSKELMQDAKDHRYGSDEAVVELVKNEIAKSEKAGRSWILQGFPRTKYQALALQKLGIIPDRVILVTKQDEQIASDVMTTLTLTHGGHTQE